jgi:hypothetical protein
MSKTLTYDQLEQIGEFSQEELMKHLLVLNLQIEVMQEQLKNHGSRLVSMDEELSTVSNLQVDLKTNIERQVMSQPNEDNPVESSLQYQHEQGLIRPSQTTQPNKHGGETVVTFADPEHQNAFDTAVGCLKLLNPDLDQEDVFDFIMFG